MRRFSLLFLLLLLATPACVTNTTAGDDDDDPGPGPTDGPLAEWTGTWQQPRASWAWECVDGPNVSYGTNDETNTSQWQITALDDRRIRAMSSANSRSWVYVVSGTVATIEAGSFSGGVNVDEPGTRVTLIRETLTKRADGTLHNDVYYEYTSAIGESCTEAQQITLRR